MQRQVDRSAKLADDALRWLAKAWKRVKLLEEEAQILRLQLSEIVKERNSAGVEAGDQLREGRALEASGRMLSVEHDSPKCRNLTDCHTEVTTRKVTNYQDADIVVVGRLHWNTMGKYRPARRSCYRALVEVSKRLKEAFDYKERSPQLELRTPFELQRYVLGVCL